MKASVALPAGATLPAHATALRLLWQGFADFELPNSLRQTTHPTVAATPMPAASKHPAHQLPHADKHNPKKHDVTQKVHDTLTSAEHNTLLTMLLHAESTPQKPILLLCLLQALMNLLNKHPYLLRPKPL